VAAGGALGAVARYLVSAQFGDGFPWGTLSVNLTGSFLLGCMLTMSVTGGRISPEIGLLFGVGFLGAFTTMSTFSIELIQLYQASETNWLLSYLMASWVGCPIAAVAGWKLVQVLAV